jgi:hypothetical protein
MSSIPESLRSNIDLFEDTGLEDPFPLYRRLRDIGPTTYLMFASV